jgi:hypothetical protein
VNTLRSVTEPGITSLEPPTQAQLRAPDQLLPAQLAERRPRADHAGDHGAAGELANPAVRGLAAKSFEKSWRKRAEATPGSEADAYITYPVYDNGVWGKPSTPFWRRDERKPLNAETLRKKAE